MKILVTGATGLVGRAFSAHARKAGHGVAALRRPDDWDPEKGFIRREALESIDAVVHLAGENIASSRWTKVKKDRILQSRVRGTQLLAAELARMPHPPSVFVSASAVGIYGDRGEEWLSEDSLPGAGFLAQVGTAWEAATEAATLRGIRTVQLRIGIVLSPDGGALAAMRTPFRAGIGGVLGDGRQYMSWIALEDLCRAILHVVETEALSGPVNAVAPHPVTNREFTRALASALWRPAILPVPRLAARAALGELADALLLASTRVTPRKLLSSGFVFAETDLDVALARRVAPVSELYSSQWIARPIEDVFPFFADARNLDRITPPWLKFQITSPAVEIRKGAMIDYRLRVHGFPIAWRSEILEWSPPHRFVDVQRRGPYTLWFHEHTFTPKDGGTLVEDRVHYAAPGGELARRLFVARDLKRIFEYRKVRLAELFA